MNSQELSTREKIIHATIFCIEREGIQGVTIRKISREAGVNSAAINYYFGTKEKLLDIALRKTLDEMSSMPEEILDAEGPDHRARLQNFFTALMDGILRYPGITRAHLYSTIFEYDYNTLFVRRFNILLEDLMSKMRGVEAKDKKKDLKITLVQIISAIVLPALMPRFVRPFAKVNFEDAIARKAYVASLMDHYFD